jgi:MATE family multidrug resistance protein
MDTLVSQAFGAGNFELVGIILQNALVMGGLFTVPIGVLWWFTGDVLLLAGVNHSIAALSQTFVRYQIPGLFPFLVYRALVKYLQCQGIVVAAVVVNWIGVALNFLLNYVMIYGMFGIGGFGFVGAPIATAMTRTCMPCLLWVYIYVTKCHKKTWFGWTTQAFSLTRLWNFFKMGMPTALSLVMEIGGYEFPSILAARFGEAVVAYHAIGLQVELVLFALPLGLSIGASIRVGHLLGEGKPKAAHFAATTALQFTLGCVGVMVCVVILTRRWLAYVYTTDPAVIDGASRLLLLVTIVMILDAWQSVNGGILRGIGRPLPATVAAFIAYYPINLTIGIACAFWAGWGVYGLWVGLGSGLLAITGACQWYIAYRVDWDHEAALARLRSEVKPTPTATATKMSEKQSVTKNTSSPRFKGADEGDEGEGLLNQSDGDLDPEANPDPDPDPNSIELQVFYSSSTHNTIDDGDDGTINTPQPHNANAEEAAAHGSDGVVMMTSEMSKISNELSPVVVVEVEVEVEGKEILTLSSSSSSLTPSSSSSSSSNENEPSTSLPRIVEA